MSEVKLVHLPLSLYEKGNEVLVKEWDIEEKKRVWVKGIVYKIAEAFPTKGSSYYMVLVVIPRKYFKKSVNWYYIKYYHFEKTFKKKWYKQDYTIEIKPDKLLILKRSDIKLKITQI